MMWDMFCIVVVFFMDVLLNLNIFMIVEYGVKLLIEGFLMIGKMDLVEKIVLVFLIFVGFDGFGECGGNKKF